MRVDQLLVACALLSHLSACGGDSGEIAAAFSDREIIADFANEVVVPTYGLLATRVAELDTAVDALAADPSADGLTAAQRAWVAARVPWEQSEGFLFGPVETFGYDPALDSWPVNKTDLDAVLAAGSEFSEQYVGSLQETQKGLHTVEYLLFGAGKQKTAPELTQRELDYLRAITKELETTSAALAAHWKDSVDGRTPYAQVLANAGRPGNTTYPSLVAAVQEILDGMVGICAELADGKLAGPYDAHDPSLVESQFSFNSIADFENNLRSVENMYTARVEAAGTRGRGLDKFIVELDSALDARVKREIQAAIDGLRAIPEPFRDAITTPSSYDEIEAAQAAIRRLQTTLERDVTPLVLR